MCYDHKFLMYICLVLFVLSSRLLGSPRSLHLPLVYRLITAAGTDLWRVSNLMFRGSRLTRLNLSSSQGVLASLRLEILPQRSWPMLLRSKASSCLLLVRSQHLNLLRLPMT
uniref:Uncharacterized protein n=1 Tax=Cannabis sativa TaxID=3483 RepID=A0A803R0Y7_CANSA